MESKTLPYISWNSYFRWSICLPLFFKHLPQIRPSVLIFRKGSKNQNAIANTSTITTVTSATIASKTEGDIIGYARSAKGVATYYEAPPLIIYSIGAILYMLHPKKTHTCESRSAPLCFSESSSLLRRTYTVPHPTPDCDKNEGATRPTIPRPRHTNKYYICWIKAFHSDHFELRTPPAAVLRKHLVCQKQNYYRT